MKSYYDKTILNIFIVLSMRKNSVLIKLQPQTSVVFQYNVWISVRRNMELVLLVVVQTKRDFVTARLIVRVLAKCCEYNNVLPKFYIIFLTKKILSVKMSFSDLWNYLNKIII
ncbi:hypothetical protein N665_0254s0002 [Sinapis alba]|nr:hypothetical protein N665_0254s0002 [Sinapis alba]